MLYQVLQACAESCRRSSEFALTMLCIENTYTDVRHPNFDAIQCVLYLSSQP